MRIHFAALALLLAPAALLPARAQDMNKNAAFTLIRGGRPIGKDTYTLAAAKGGFKLASRLGYHINGVDSSSSDDFKLDQNYTYIEGGITNIAEQYHLAVTPNKTRDEMNFNLVKNGTVDNKHIPVKPFFTVMPAWDAGAAQVMLLVATTHPTPDNLYNIVIPGAIGAAAPGADAGDANNPGATTSSTGNYAFDALWTKGPDATGTLNGKPVPVHTYILKAGDQTWTFYAGDDHNLLQCDVTMLHASYIRAGFTLPPTP